MKPDFVQVVRENASWLLSYVKQSVKNSDIAEDLVQDVLSRSTVTMTVMKKTDNCGAVSLQSF